MSSNLKREVLDRLEQMGVSAKRSLGQNFLINPNIIERIVDQVEAFKPTAVLEVGPGLGALTEPLRVRMAALAPLRVIEMDREFAAHWRQQPNLDVVEADALTVNWNDLNLPSGTVFVSNLPYQISARVVIDRTVAPAEVQAMVLMFQREVAERVMAPSRTKEYGFLSVVAQLGWNVKKLVDARPVDFTPSPRVSSRVLSFQRKAVVSAEEVSFLKRSFENRRKYMLKNFAPDAARLLEVLRPMGFDEKVRAEELSPAQFHSLFEAWKAK